MMDENNSSNSFHSDILTLCTLIMILEDKNHPVPSEANSIVCILKIVLFFMTIKVMHFNEKKSNNLNMSKTGRERTMQSGWQRDNQVQEYLIRILCAGLRRSQTGTETTNAIKILLQWATWNWCRRGVHYSDAETQDKGSGGRRRGRAQDPSQRPRRVRQERKRGGRRGRSSV